jgi:DNA-binding GntR family transcriptional regulator
MELMRLTRQRASDEVYQALRHSILGQVFKPGGRLQVDEIAARLGVSLTPVRQAIQQLAAEGLVEIRPRSGTFVALLTEREVEETCELRCALECLAAELAVQRASSDDLAEFRRILLELGKPVETEEDRQRHESENSRLHGLLIQCSGNSRLAATYKSLNAHLQIVRAHGRDVFWAERLPVEHAEHEEIVAAIEARDTARLVAALRKHILRAKSSMISGLKG